MAATLMLIRHGEKPLGGVAPFGVSIDGRPDPESLTPLGWQRAGALVRLFAGPDATLPTPTHLVASQVGVKSSSRRPLETLEPLAARLGLTVDTRFLKQDIGRLAPAIVALDGVVLVSWEHHLIPSIANSIVGDLRTVPQIWPDDRFDLVWRFDLRPAGGYAFRQVPEMLLAGDRLDPIVSVVTDAHG
jgi:broad specificity phosphatase PhoE